MSNLPEYKGLRSQVLAYINTIREKTGRSALVQLPKGVPGDASTCIIAAGVNKEFDAEVDGYTVVVTDPNPSVNPEPPIFNYDTGEYSYPWDEYDELTAAAIKYEGDLPTYAKAFIERFDSGWMPDLIKPGQWKKKEGLGFYDDRKPLSPYRTIRNNGDYAASLRQGSDFFEHAV